MRGGDTKQQEGTPTLYLPPKEAACYRCDVLSAWLPHSRDRAVIKRIESTRAPALQPRSLGAEFNPVTPPAPPLSPRTHCRTGKPGPSRASRHRRPTHLEERRGGFVRAQTTPGNGSNVGLGREFTTLGGLCLKISPQARDRGCSSTSEPLL